MMLQYEPLMQFPVHAATTLCILLRQDPSWMLLLQLSWICPAHQTSSSCLLMWLPLPSWLTWRTQRVNPTRPMQWTARSCASTPAALSETEPALPLRICRYALCFEIALLCGHRQTSSQGALHWAGGRFERGIGHGSRTATCHKF